MNKQKGFINIILIVAIGIALFIAGTYLVATDKIGLPFYRLNPTPVACTQEAKLCSDGSYVSRTGPNCEFTQCPTINPAPTICDYPTPPSGCIYVAGPDFNQQTLCGMVLKCQTGNKILMHEGQREGSLLIERIYPNYITGLNFREYPVVVEQGQPITLYIGQSASNGCTIALTLDSINITSADSKGRAAIFSEIIDFNKPCPICLAEDTLIDTPNGALPVQKLQKGMIVWTVDELGKRIATTIIKTSKTPVPKTHQMVHIVLDDKREIFASPRHPIGDGRIMQNLSVGDFLDGNYIITAEKVSYSKGYTYDILPSGTTGLYWANDILIDSTLR